MYCYIKFRFFFFTLEITSIFEVNLKNSALNTNHFCNVMSTLIRNDKEVNNENSVFKWEKLPHLRWNLLLAEVLHHSESHAKIFF